MTSNDKQAPFVTDNEAKLMWALLKMKGVGVTNWEEVAAVLDPVNPEQKGTVAKRWSRLQTRLTALDPPVAEGDATTAAGSSESKPVKTPKTPKTPRKRAPKTEDDDATPSKKRKAAKTPASGKKPATSENEKITDDNNDETSGPSADLAKTEDAIADAMENEIGTVDDNEKTI